MTLAQMDHRDQQILCGLFLSKFDQNALQYLGFASYTEAFNVLGYGLGARPASIKNYRDEFDPVLSNTRKGWHRRPIRPHCQSMLERYSGLGLNDLGILVKELLCPFSALQDSSDVGATIREFGGPDSPFAKRLMTGRAAEEYFRSHYRDIPEFTGQSVTDTTLWGCGFDFKLTKTNDASFVAVEVKGMQNRSGQLQMTELEHAMARTLMERFFLFVVRNFAETPYHTVIQNPLASELPFERIERIEKRSIWQVSIPA